MYFNFCILKKKETKKKKSKWGGGREGRVIEREGKLCTSSLSTGNC
jgi:hypothetical protein